MARRVKPLPGSTASRKRDPKIVKDHTGYWLRTVMEKNGLPDKTAYTVRELRGSSRLLSAVTEALTDWFKWNWDEEIEMSYLATFTTREQVAELGLFWILRFLDNADRLSKEGQRLFPDSMVIEFDTAKYLSPSRVSR